MKRILPIVYLLALMSSGFAQDKQEANTNPSDPKFNISPDEFLNNQAEALLRRADEVFRDYPPAWPEPTARPGALLLLDGVLHELDAPKRRPVQTFLKECLNRAVDEIEQTEVTDGARIWKLYNHGFLIRTESVTIGFDLVSGKSTGIVGFSMADDDMRRLIDQCDVLFISHRHDDHAEDSVIQSFIDQGKPVVAPPEIWQDQPAHAQITHLKRESHSIQELPVQDGEQVLKVVVYPGHQGYPAGHGADIENNVSLVITPEGLSFSQMGDQSSHNDFVWIDEVGDNHVVDVLMPNCWTMDIARVAKGFNPSLIIPGHENEMGHSIQHRQPYWLNYQRQKGSDRFSGNSNVGYDIPLIVMNWGESYHYLRETFLE